MKIHGQNARLFSSYGPDKLKLYRYHLNDVLMVALVDCTGKIDNLIWYGKGIGDGDIIGFDGTHFKNPAFITHYDTIVRHVLEIFKKEGTGTL